MYKNFDSKTTGLYYAICDLTNAYHAMGWINIRFYYNFETQKMEPVAYDPYPVLKWGQPYLGKNCFTKDLNPLDTKMIVYNALHIPNISKAYYLALHRITQPQYISSFLYLNCSGTYICYYMIILITLFVNIKLSKYSNISSHHIYILHLLEKT